MTDTAVATILSRLDQFESDVNSRFGSVDARLAKIEAKIDEKPGIGTLYQVTFGTVLGLCAFAAALIAILRATSIIP